jgi:hypothetical protein
LFEEWQSTVVGKAGHFVERMPETHVVPWVKGSRLCMERRSAAGFVPIMELQLPSNASTLPQSSDRRVKDLHGCRGLCVLFVAEGYTEEEESRFDAHAASACELLLATEPFATLGSHVQFKSLFAPSQIAGIPSFPGAPGTRYGTAYGTLGMARYLVCHNQHALRQDVAGVRWDTLVVLANSDVYGGSGIFNSCACVAVDMGPADMGYVLPHELGHSLGGLGDEYFGKEVTYAIDGEDAWLAWEPNISALDPDNQVKWSDRLGASVVIPTPWQHESYSRAMREVVDPVANKEHVASLLAAEPALGTLGVFEGARYRARGMYRPEVDCRMFSKTAGRFCSICMRTLEEAILSAGKSVATLGSRGPV